MKTTSKYLRLAFAAAAVCATALSFSIATSNAESDIKTVTPMTEEANDIPSWLMDRDAQMRLLANSHKKPTDNSFFNSPDNSNATDKKKRRGGICFPLCIGPHIDRDMNIRIGPTIGRGGFEF